MFKKTIVFLMASAIITSCATIAKYDQYAYTQTTSLKVDALGVMSNANESFASHQQEVSALQTSMSKMLEYEKNQPKNVVSGKMWAILTDSTGNLLGGFLTRWKKEGTLDTAFVNNAKLLVGQSFDEISQLESGKIKPNQVTAN